MAFIVRFGCDSPLARPAISVLDAKRDFGVREFRILVRSIPPTVTVP